MSGLASFSKEEINYILEFEKILKDLTPSLFDAARRRRMDLELLSGIVLRAPSILNDLGLGGYKRNEESLVRAINDRGLADMNRQPTKAVLGFSFSISKLHYYGLLHRIAQKYSEELRGFFFFIERAYRDQLFSLMAEQLFRKMLEEPNPGAKWSINIARDLVHLWEYRFTEKEILFAPFVESLWDIRGDLVSKLGTLLGASELFELTINLPEVWSEFINSETSNFRTVLALEEFLFELDFEEIGFLRKQMELNRIAAISREDLPSLLSPFKDRNERTGLTKDKKHRITDLPANSLYNSFLRRCKNAEVRKIRGAEGPWETVEECFVKFYYSTEAVWEEDFVVDSHFN